MTVARERQWRESSGRSSRSPKRTPVAAAREWWRTGGALALGACLFVFVAHVAYGSNNDRLSMVLTTLVAAALCGLYAASPGARRALGRVDRRVAAACLLFAIAFAIALVGLTPWAPGGPHPVWGYVADAPAVTLSRSDTALTLIRLAGVGCAYLFGLALARRDETAAHLFSALLIVFSLFAFWAMYNFLTDPAGLFGHRRELVVMRLTAAFESPNSAALLVSIGLVLAVADILRTVRRYEGWKGVFKRAETGLPRLAPAVICSLLCAADLILTQSRVGAIAVLLALTALGVSEALRARKSDAPKGPSLLIGGLSVGVLFLALILVRPELITRLMTAGPDFQVRETIFSTHWRAIQASPWFGYGLGTFDGVNKLATTVQNYEASWNIRALHDVYLEWIEGVGFVGAIPMFAAVLAALIAVADGAFRRERMAGWRRAILCISLIVCLMGLTDYGLEEPSIAVMWALLLGVGAGLKRA